MNRFEKHMGTPLDAACLIAEYIHCAKCPVEDECKNSDDPCEEVLARWIEEEVEHD